MATTNPATGGAVRRWRNTSHSSPMPSSGASTSTETMRAGAVGQPQVVWVLKKKIAET